MQDRKSKRRPPQNSVELPVIPHKLYSSIGEAAELCDLETHILRYWEQEFPQLNPTKRRGGRRYYQRKDILLIHKIRSLLYEQGFTIEGARKQLMEDQSKPTLAQEQDSETPILQKMLLDLENILAELQ